MRNELEQATKVAQQYINDGYRVVLHPIGEERPEFLGDFQPDIIAYGNEENVVIEIKTRPELVDNHRLSYIASRVNAEPGWRFDLVITSPQSQWENLVERSEAEIQELVRKAERLIDLQENDAAHLIAWSALEASLRKLLSAEERDSKDNNPRYLLNTLYSQGIFSRSDYDRLLEAMQVRNAIVHGFKASGNYHPAFLLDMTDQLLHQKTSANGVSAHH